VKKPITFDDVRRMAEGLEGVEVGTTYGTPALKVRGRVFACIASHRSAEPDTLVAVISFDDREQLLEADPAIYYLKDHYLNYPSILVRLRQIHPDALRDLLRMAWNFVSARARARRSPSRSTPARRRRRPPRFRD
jgi:hypothetical protein